MTKKLAQERQEEVEEEAEEGTGTINVIFSILTINFCKIC